MNRSWHPIMTGSALGRALQVAALAALLAGCSSSDSGTSQPAATSPSYPNLGTVPSAAPATSTPTERQQITSGLVADQQNAAYSDQPLTAQSGLQSSAPPPAPATTVAPAATASDTSSGTQAPATTMETQTAAAPAAASADQTAPAAVPADQSTTATAAAAAQPQLPAAPQPTAGITPLAPPPNPIPPAPAPTQMASAMPPLPGSVSVDQSQLGGTSAPEQLYPAPYAPFYGAPAGNAPAYGPGNAGMAPAAGLPPAGFPIAVVFFEDASASLSDRAMGVLRDVALIQQQQGGRLRIVGHSSARTAAVSYSAHDAINQRLSQARGNAVANALIRFGALPGTIGVTAVGSQQPVYFEFMPTGEAGNRRVEVFLDR
jgi:outer membrane protein OmpA-like peptidoglycan-associated protein